MDDHDVHQSVRHVMSAARIHVDGDTTLRDAASVLTQDGIGVVLVRYGAGSVGIVSERDIVRALGDGGDPDSLVASDIVQAPLVTIGVDDRILDGARLMVSEDVRHLAVVDRDEIVGVVSVRDLLPVLAAYVPKGW
jgi:CBS domain-containing protein